MRKTALPIDLRAFDYRRVALLGLLVVLAFSHETLLTTPSEYITFYEGGRLVGTPYLYDMAHGYEEQIKAVGGYGDQFLFVRIPFCAVLHLPLTLLPYHIALRAWLVILFGVLLAFLFTWNITDRKLTLLACCWSLPLVFDFAFGKDTTVLILILAVALRLYAKSPAAAGVVLSLLAIKYHLFFLLPLLILTRRTWKIAAGFSCGAVIIAAISFWAGGMDWPVRLIALLGSQSKPHEFLMPNIRGLLAPFTDLFLPELLLDIVVALFAWTIIRKTDFVYGMAAVLVGGVLVSHHAAVYDCVVLIPALLILMDRSAEAVPNRSLVLLNCLCLFLLTPLPYVLVTYGPVLGLVTKLSLFALLFVMGRQARNLGSPYRISAPQFGDGIAGKAY